MVKEDEKRTREVKLMANDYKIIPFYSFNWNNNIDDVHAAEWCLQRNYKRRRLEKTDESIWMIILLVTMLSAFPWFEFGAFTLCISIFTFQHFFFTNFSLFMFCHQSIQLWKHLEILFISCVCVFVFACVRCPIPTTETFQIQNDTDFLAQNFQSST